MPAGCARSLVVCTVWRGIEQTTAAAAGETAPNEEAGAEGNEEEWFRYKERQVIHLLGLCAARPRIPAHSLAAAPWCETPAIAPPIPGRLPGPMTRSEALQHSGAMAPDGAGSGPCTLTLILFVSTLTGAIRAGLSRLQMWTISPPVRSGGTDDEENLQALCHECHSAKTASEDGRWG